jgi:multiple sugar transport system permease protein
VDQTWKLTKTTVVYALLCAGAFIVAFPVIWLLLSSFKPQNQIFAYPPALLPSQPTLENFRILLTERPFARWLLNSLIVASSVTVLSVVVHSMAGYALARLEFPGREVVFLAIMATYILPMHAIIIPRFLIVKQLGWLDTYQGLIIPACFHAFGIFAFRQFFLSIPKELEDAALIDGASRLRIFLEIVLPLSKSTVLIVGTVFFINNWDSFIWPLLVTRSPNLRVAQVGISTFLDPNIKMWELVISSSVLTMLPGLILFFVLQQYIVQGIKTTGIKS